MPTVTLNDISVSSYSSVGQKSDKGLTLKNQGIGRALLLLEALGENLPFPASIPWLRAAFSIGKPAEVGPVLLPLHLSDSPPLPASFPFGTFVIPLCPPR